MSNILKPIDLTDLAIRRAVFAALDGLAAEHRANRKGEDRLSVRGLASLSVGNSTPNRRNDDAG